MSTLFGINRLIFLTFVAKNLPGTEIFFQNRNNFVIDNYSRRVYHKYSAYTA